MKEYDDNNIISELNFIMKYVLSPSCDKFTILEKVRWLYIMCGRLFCYDFRIMNGELDVANKKVDFENNTINKFQTCTQISKILNIMLNNIDPDKCKSKIIKRNIDNVASGVDHVANEVTINGKKYLLDLTLDLYLIQSGCQTREFAYTTDANNTQNIISLAECEQMDNNIGLLPLDGYTDDKIKKIRNIVGNIDFSKYPDAEILNRIILIIKNSLMYNFDGPHESKMYIAKLINDFILDCPFLRVDCKEYNLYFSNGDEDNFITCYIFDLGNDKVCYTYSNKLGMVNSSFEFIDSLLNSGWKTNSNSLEKLIQGNVKNKSL